LKLSTTMNIPLRLVLRIGVLLSSVSGCVQAFGAHAPIISQRQRYPTRHPTLVVVVSSLAASSSASVHEQALFKKQGGILYRTSIFNKTELALIRQELADYQKGGRLKDEIASSVAQHRMGAVLSSNNDNNRPSSSSSTSSQTTMDILREGSLTQWIRTVTQNPNYVLRDDQVPVEIRSYEKPNACMAWHRDDVLFDPPQLEIVWTLENSSDCRTLWKDDHDETTVHAVETDPNAALLIPAGGAEHCVSSLKRGRRVILKCVYALQDAKFVSGSHLHQFDKGKKEKNTKRKQQQQRRRRR